MARNAPHGFTLLEMMTVVAVVGVIATLALQNYTRFVAKAKRTEATGILHALDVAQLEYWSFHGEFAADFDALGFHVRGEERLSATQIRAERYVFALSRPNGPGSWYCSATGDIDGDQWLDVITIEDQR